MKSLVSSLLNILSVFTLIVLISAVTAPFYLMNLDQAHRIAKWKLEYEELVYSFNLVKMHEKTIVPNELEAGRILSDYYLYERIKPYFNLSDSGFETISGYSFSKMNGKPVFKTEEFYFDKFMQAKNGVILSVKKNSTDIIDKSQPLFYMFVDINGTEKPNKIGEDIFFLNIFENEVTALGYDKPTVKLKTNCSPIGSGIYCSSYYLLGGRF